VAQVRDHMIYQGGEVLLLRAAARSLDSAFVPWPDPADGEELRMWLVKAWEDRCCGRLASALGRDCGP
jgi:hypothetical protein